jgi:hypothetical protein
MKLKNKILSIFFLLRQKSCYDKQFFKEGVKFGNGDILFNGIIELRTVEDMGEGGIKKLGKSGDDLYGWPLLSGLY